MLHSWPNAQYLRVLLFSLRYPETVEVFEESKGFTFVKASAYAIPSQGIMLKKADHLL